MKIIFSIFTFIILFVPFCKIKAQSGDINDEKLWQAFKTKKEQIEQEIKQNETNWAGEYRMFDNTLTIAPKSGYAFLLRRAAFDHIFVVNDVRLSNGRIKLVIEPNSKWQKLSIFSSELIPVLWGERHYLIPENEIIDFANAINGGYEPASKTLSFGNSFYLRSGDANKKVKGEPDIPEKYRGYLLKKPIKAKILEIRATVENLDESGEKQKETIVILNVGSKQGVKEGMKFLTISPVRVHENVFVTRVKNERSEGKILQTSKYSTPPNLNWKLSTSINFWC